ncbi:MAG: hypothetical protein QME66_07825 [Candidatus Eisenbacteria bacterium]|nr:hypothetical protein [Candidatus Eisenbacteria bacterium]
MKSKLKSDVVNLLIPSVVFLLFSLWIGVQSSLAGLNADARLALHVRPHLAKASCSTSGITGCGDIVTSAAAQDNDYDVYVIATNVGELRTYEFGISYPESETNGIKVWSWRNCGGFELPSTGFPGPGAGVVVSRDSCSTPPDGFVIFDSSGNQLLGLEGPFSGGQYGATALPFDACGDFAARVGLDKRVAYDRTSRIPLQITLWVYDLKTGGLAWEKSFDRNSPFAPLFVKCSRDGSRLVIFSYVPGILREPPEPSHTPMETKAECFDASTGALLWSRVIEPQDHIKEFRESNTLLDLVGISVCEGATRTALLYATPRRRAGELVLLDERGNMMLRQNMSMPREVGFLDACRFLLVSRIDGLQQLYAIH